MAGATHAGELSSIERPPVFTWTGFYGGQNAGYTWTPDSPAQAPDGVIGAAFDAAGSAFNAASGGSPGQPPSFLGGGQIGFNYQIEALVFGFESDLTYTNLARVASPSALSNGSTESVAYTSGVGSHWLSTARGRFGTAIDDRLLVFTTGGLAIAGRTFNNGAVVLSPEGQDFSIGTAARAAAGLALGGGLEYALTKNWTLKGEYLYTDLGPGRTFGNYNAPTGAVSRANDLDEKVLRAAINYKFDWLSAPGTAAPK